MKSKEGVSINFNRQKHVGEIPDSVVDLIFPNVEGKEKEIKKQKDTWIKKYKLVKEEAVKDVDTSTGG